VPDTRSVQLGEQPSCEAAYFFVVVLEGALRDAPHGLRGGRDAEHVGDLAHPPEVIEEFRHAGRSVRGRALKTLGRTYFESAHAPTVGSAPGSLAPTYTSLT
jgi:hypothetical protein